MRRGLKIILSALIVLGSLFLLQRLLVPKYVDGVVEGAFVAEYYREVKDHDVIFVGDCEVYENFSPAVLWEEYGINSYIRGSAEQYIWQSYYLLEDTLRYETPKAVVFNIQSLQFGESQREAYNRMSLEYMFKTEPVSFNGYYMRVDVRAAENVPEGKPLADYGFGENAWKYLDMMVELCEEKGIELILIKAPSLYPYWYPQWEKQVEAYAAEKDLPYINFLDIQEKTGIDYTTDTYDGGLHMNLSGAEKLSRYMGRYLRDEAGIPDRRGEAELAGRWAEKLAAYEAEKRAQYEYYGMTEED